MYGTLGAGFGSMMAFILGGGGVAAAVALAANGRFILAPIVLIIGIVAATPFVRLELSGHREAQKLLRQRRIQELEQELGIGESD